MKTYLCNQCSKELNFGKMIAVRCSCGTWNERELPKKRKVSHKDSAEMISEKMKNGLIIF